MSHELDVEREETNIRGKDYRLSGEQMAVSEELLLLRSTKQDMLWFKDHYDYLLKEYKNQFVAIKDCQPVASSPKFDALLNELKAKGVDPVKTLVKYVTDAYTIL